MYCEQNNPLSNLVRHVTDDVRLQETIGAPRASTDGRNQYMPQQSFRMNDLMNEIRHCAPQHMVPPSQVPSHSSPGTMWPMQEDFQPPIEPMWNVPNVNYVNEPNYLPAGFVSMMPPYGLPESQNFMENESIPRKSRNTLTVVEGGITLDNVDDLKYLNQPEDDDTCLKKSEDEQLLKQSYNDAITERRTILPEFSSARQFTAAIEKFIINCQKEKWILKHPNQTYHEATSENVLNPMVYSHIENNPMKEVLEPSIAGEEAINNFCFFKAELYLDEAVRKPDADPRNWYLLSYALYMNNKADKAMSAIEHYLRFKPNCINGVNIKQKIYRENHCHYQACQTIFNWLKNNKLYKHLVPPGFSMDDKNTTELEVALLDSVKEIFLRAARENPINNIDDNLQIMIGNLYSISGDYDKVADCKRAAMIRSGYSSDKVNLGYMLFYEEKHNEALDLFFQAAADPHYGVNAYADIAFVYMYLKNYREAIRYLKAVLGPEAHKFQLEGGTLEQEFELCLQMYVAIRCR